MKRPKGEWGQAQYENNINLLVNFVVVHYYFPKSLHHAHFSADLLGSSMTVLVTDKNAYFPRKRNT